MGEKEEKEEEEPSMSWSHPVWHMYKHWCSPSFTSSSHFSSPHFLLIHLLSSTIFFVSFKDLFVLLPQL